MSLIFVYGTLKRGFSNNGQLAGQAFLGESRTAPGFALFDLGSHPGMVARPGEPCFVSGEVWRVDAGCLERLDVFEGSAEGLFVRGTVPLLGPFADRGAQAYYYSRSVQGRSQLGSAWTE